jgi:uncharacterized protein with NAD-binding domain and iron-sulfur cluster
LYVSKVFPAKETCVFFPDEKREGVESSEWVVGSQQFHEFVVHPFHFPLGMTTPRLAENALVATTWSQTPKDSQTNEEAVTDALHRCNSIE